MGRCWSNVLEIGSRKGGWAGRKQWEVIGRGTRGDIGLVLTPLPGRVLPLTTSHCPTCARSCYQATLHIMIFDLDVPG